MISRAILYADKLLLCSHSPNDVPPRTSAKRIHSRGTGRRASVQKYADRCYLEDFI